MNKIVVGSERPDLNTHLNSISVLENETIYKSAFRYSKSQQLVR